MGNADLLKRFWGDDEKLDSTDKFLRNYILTQGWKTGDHTFEEMNQQDPKLEKADKEDEERGEEMEKFENAYNFRFEEMNGQPYLVSKK